MESKEVCNVLHEDVSGSKVAYGSKHLSPKRSLGMSEAFAFTSTGNSLAGETAGEQSDAGSVIPNCSYVVIGVDSGPAQTEDVSPACFSFAEPSVLEAGEVQSEVEQSVAAEEASDIHLVPVGGLRCTTLTPQACPT